MGVKKSPKVCADFHMKELTEEKWLTPLLKGLDRLVSVSKETVSTLHTLVPRQTSLCRWRSIILGPF